MIWLDYRLTFFLREFELEGDGVVLADADDPVDNSDPVDNVDDPADNEDVEADAGNNEGDDVGEEDDWDGDLWRNDMVPPTISPNQYRLRNIGMGTVIKAT